MITETVFYFAALALVTVVISVYLKESGMPTAAMLTAVCGGILILLKLLPYFVGIFQAIEDLAAASDLKTDYLGLVFKVVCIAYIGEFAGQLCRDAGESGIGQKVELGTKMIILLMAVPLLQTLLSTVITVFD